MNIPREIFVERFNALPKPVAEYLSGPDLGKEVQSIATAQGLHVDTAGVLGELVLQMLLGLVSPQELPITLMNRLNLKQETANTIINDLNSRIFKPLGDRVRNQPPKEVAGPEEETAPAPVQQPPAAAIPPIIPQPQQMEPRKPAPLPAPTFISPAAPPATPQPVLPPAPALQVMPEVQAPIAAAIPSWSPSVPILPGSETPVPVAPAPAPMPASVRIEPVFTREEAPAVPVAPKPFPPPPLPVAPTPAVQPAPLSPLPKKEYGSDPYREPI